MSGEVGRRMELRPGPGTTQLMREEVWAPEAGAEGKEGWGKARAGKERAHGRSRAGLEREGMGRGEGEAGKEGSEGMGAAEPPNGGEKAVLEKAPEGLVVAAAAAAVALGLSPAWVRWWRLRWELRLKHLPHSGHL